MLFFFTPTVSYRNLSENKSYLRSPSLVGIPYNYAALYDVNNMVTHKPNIGLELGVTSKYAITKNIKLRGGLQFNINRYDIKAFKYSPERPTIVLNSGSSGVQSVSATSTYRNLNGGETDWIQNFPALRRGLIMFSVGEDRFVKSNKFLPPARSPTEFLY